MPTRRDAGARRESSDQQVAFRTELLKLQARLLTYTRALADMAGVEDLTGLEG